MPNNRAGAKTANGFVDGLKSALNSAKEERRKRKEQEENEKKETK